MSPTSRDLLVGLIAGVGLTVAITLLLTPELESPWARQIVASVPVLTAVLGWFAYRRSREVERLNAAVRKWRTEYERTSRQRRNLENQIREWYGAVTMGTLGERFTAELLRLLNPARGLAREAEMEAAHGPERTRHRLIAEAAEGAIEIVGRMQLLEGASDREAETVVAADAVRQAVEMAKGEFDVTLDVDYRMHNEASRIRINRWELGETTRQLIKNAVEAMGPGGRMVVSVDRTQLNAYRAKPLGLAAGAHVRICVTDNGPGIPDQLMGHVFEPFFTTKGAGDGKGLGLAVTYSLVRRWNANLSVQSAPEEGATFEILIPVAPGAAR